MYLADMFPLSESPAGKNKTRTDLQEWSRAITQCTHPAFWLQAQSPPLYIHNNIHIHTPTHPQAYDCLGLIPHPGADCEHLSNV